MKNTHSVWTKLTMVLFLKMKTAKLSRENVSCSLIFSEMIHHLFYASTCSSKFILFTIIKFLIPKIDEIIHCISNRPVFIPLLAGALGRRLPLPTWCKMTHSNHSKFLIKWHRHELSKALLSTYRWAVSKWNTRLSHLPNANDRRQNQNFTCQQLQQSKRSPSSCIFEKFIECVNIVDKDEWILWYVREDDYHNDNGKKN